MTTWKKLAERLAEYHGCVISRKYVQSEFGKKSMVFEFKCGNGFSFDTGLDDTSGLPSRTLTYEQLIRKYLGMKIFVLFVNDRTCDEWNDFPMKIIKANSPEELEVKLTAIGF